MMMLMKIMNMTHVLSLRHKEETTLIPVQKLENYLEYDNEKESTEGSGILETYDA